MKIYLWFDPFYYRFWLLFQIILCQLVNGMSVYGCINKIDSFGMVKSMRLGWWMFQGRISSIQCWRCMRWKQWKEMACPDVCRVYGPVDSKWECLGEDSTECITRRRIDVIRLCVFAMHFTSIHVQSFYNLYGKYCNQWFAALQFGLVVCCFGFVCCMFVRYKSKPFHCSVSVVLRTKFKYRNGIN